jgi:hypothetical protein
MEFNEKGLEGKEIKCCISDERCRTNSVRIGMKRRKLEKTYIFRKYIWKPRRTLGF